MFDSSEDDAEFVIQCLSQPDAKRRSSGNVYIKCPFHGEKTASFVYRPKTRRWYCYGCHANGEIPETLLAYNGPLEGQLRFSFKGKFMSEGKSMSDNMMSQPEVQAPPDETFERRYDEILQGIPEAPHTEAEVRAAFQRMMPEQDATLRLIALQKAVEGWIKTLPASNRMAKEMEEALQASRTESK